MTEFKRGDRVVFVEDDHYEGVEMPKGTRGTYDDDNPTSSTPWVKLDTGERVVAWHDCIAPAEPETPAPLDPAKVKPGDTVTLEMEGGRKVTAPVSERTGFGDTWLLDVYPDDGPVSFSKHHWTLTAHTPAPERVEGGEVTAAVERAAEAIRTSVIDTPTEKAAPIMARAGLAAALDVEEMARIISAHRHGSQVAWDEDRRIAEALRAAIVGGAA